MRATWSMLKPRSISLTAKVKPRNLAIIVYLKTFNFFTVKLKKDIIEKADAVICVVGMKHSDEGEYIVVIGGDRKQLGLKRKEPEMLREVGSLNKNTVAVVMGGNMVRMNEWHDSINSILFAYYPGMEGGTAIADIIFGKVNPGGKLPFVIGKKDSDFPQVKWLSLGQEYSYYHGYKKLHKDKKAEDYSYGFGLSYTDFEIKDINFSVGTLLFKIQILNLLYIYNKIYF